MAKITRQDLIDLAYILYLSCPIDEGFSHRFSIMLGQALLVQHENKFFARLKLIEDYKDQENGFEQLKQATYYAMFKDRNKDTLSEQDRILLEIALFFHKIVAETRPLSFNSVILDEFKTPISIISNDSYALDRDQLTAYLSKLEENLKESDSITPIILSNTKHSILISYDTTKQQWMYFNTNLLDSTLGYPLWVDNKLLAELIFLSFHYCAKYVGFNIQAISSPPAKANDKEIFQSLKSQYAIRKEHVNRYNLSGLLNIACAKGDLDTVNKLVLLEEIDIDKKDIGNSSSQTIFSGYAEGLYSVLPMSLPKINPDQNKDERSPLMVACLSGNVDIVKALLRHPKIDINKVARFSEDTLSALSIACSKKDAEIVKILVQCPGIKIAPMDEPFIKTLFIPEENETIQCLDSKSKDFIKLLKANPSFACDLFKQNKNEAVRLIDSADVFLQLHQEAPWLTHELFQYNEGKIVFLFCTDESLRRLKELDAVFHKRVIEARRDMSKKLIGISRPDGLSNSRYGTFIDRYNVHNESIQTPHFFNPPRASQGSSNSNNIKNQFLIACITVLACAGVAVAFALFMGILPGLMVAAFGGATILGGAGVCAACNTYKKSH